MCMYYQFWTRPFENNDFLFWNERVSHQWHQYNKMYESLVSEGRLKSKDLLWSVGSFSSTWFQVDPLQRLSGPPRTMLAVSVTSLLISLLSIDRLMCFHGSNVSSGQSEHQHTDHNISVTEHTVWVLVTSTAYLPDAAVTILNSGGWTHHDSDNNNDDNYI